MTNSEIFKKTFAKYLEENVRKKPLDYSYSVNELGPVLERMNRAIDRMSFNKDSESFKQTCKELKIKHTYKAIEQFIKGQSYES